MGGNGAQGGNYASPTMSEVHADSVAYQMATPSDHAVGGQGGGNGKGFVGELDGRQHYELA